MVKKRAKAHPHPLLSGALGLAALNLLLFGDVLFNGKGLILSSDRADLYLHFVAWREFAFSQLRQGHLVLWNPHYLCGAPFFGGFEAALLYPPNWFYLVLPLAFAINSGIVLHVFLAGFFTFLWAYHRKLHPYACFLAGTVFMFGGAYYLHLYAGHLPNLCTMVWAPLLFLAIDGLVEGIALGWILLGVFAVTMQILAGHPQYLYFTAIIAGLYTLLNLIGHKSPLKILVGFGVIYMGASMLAAIQLWTGVQSLMECGRTIPLEYRSAGSFSFPPENLLTLFLPEFFGNLDSTHYWGRWFLWEVSLFIGVAALFLVVFGLFSGEPSKRKWALTTAGITFFFSLGIYTFLFWFFYHFFPGFNGLRGLCKFDFLVALFLALLAGIGLDQLLRGPRTPRWPLVFTAVSGLLLLALGLGIMDSSSQGASGMWGQWQSHIHWLKSAVASMAPADLDQFLQDSGRHAAFSLWIGGELFCFLSLLLLFRDLYPRVAFAVGALAILELFVFARLNRPTFELSTLQKKFDQLKGVYDRDPGDYRVFGTASAALVTGGYDLWEDEPMVLGRYGRFACASQGLAENQLFSVLPIYKKFTPLFGLLRLKYVISGETDPMELYPTRFKLVPRMSLVQNVQMVPNSKEALDLLLKPGFDAGKNVLLEESPDPLPASGPVDGTVTWKDLSTDEIEVTAQTSKASLLLVTDNYSKGWRVDAFPDSVQTVYRLLPADTFLRAVPLAPGRHHFRMEFRPTAFVAGKWVSILSCILYVGILSAWWRRKHP